jgi:hypothetical protein
LGFLKTSILNRTALLIKEAIAPGFGQIQHFIQACP